MKRIIALLSWLALVAGTGCYEKSGTTGAGTGPMLRYHFAGFTDLAGGATNSRLQNVAAAPATDALRRDLAQKLAKAPALYWQKQLPAGAADPSALFLPLFEDLLAFESAVEVRGSSTRPELTLAAALSEERHQQSAILSISELLLYLVFFIFVCSLYFLTFFTPHSGKYRVCCNSIQCMILRRIQVPYGGYGMPYYSLLIF